MWRKIDWPGVLLSIAGSSLLVIPLEEGGVQFAWKSVPIIVMFGASAIFYLAFLAWETLVHRRQTIWSILPLFPARLLQRRVLAANFRYSAPTILVSWSHSADTEAALYFLPAFRLLWS
jgi:hypothetical protein